MVSLNFEYHCLEVCFSPYIDFLSLHTIFLFMWPWKFHVGPYIIPPQAFYSEMRFSRPSDEAQDPNEPPKPKQFKDNPTLKLERMSLYS